MTPSRRRRRPRAALVALALVAVAALAGCGQARAGSAAIVGDAVLTENQLNQTAVDLADFAATLPSTPTLDMGAANRSLVTTWVNEQLTDLVAADYQVTVTQGEIDRFLDKSGGRDAIVPQAAVQLFVPPDALDALVATILQRDKLGQLMLPQGSAQQQAQAVAVTVAEKADAVGTWVNPRYGAFDAAQGKLLDRPDDLSSPAPTPSAGPSSPGPLIPRGQ